MGFGFGMKEHFQYDAVVKDLFQRDRPSLLDHLAGGVAVKEFLNLELSAVEKRVADLLVLLADETILHIDFQSTNDPQMAYREALYAVMAGMKFKDRKIQQVVVYLGQRKMKMLDRLDLGCLQSHFRVLDIRELDCEVFLQSGRVGDYALAMLAGGGVGNLRKIVREANRLPPHERKRAFTQMALLSGLRGASEQLTMEMKSMGISLAIEKNVFIRDAYESGRAEGKVELVRGMLEAKFGPLPRWAQGRLRKATSDDLQSWAKKTLTSSTLEGVIGKQKATPASPAK